MTATDFAADVVPLVDLEDATFPAAIVKQPARRKKQLPAFAPGEMRLPLLTKGRIEQLASVPITGFNGYNGTGKSMAGILCAMAHLEAGRPVLSTVRMQDYRNPRPCTDSGCKSGRHGLPGHLAAHPLWEPFTDWRQLLAFRAGYVLMDETTGVADARSHAGMPVQVGNYLPQLRRKDAFLGWTTIDWRFADARLRRVTFALLWATGLRPEYVGDEMWGRNRLFYWRVYDSRGIGDDFDPSTKRDGVQLLSRIYFRREPSLAQHAYDTLDDVLTLGVASEGGICMHCGKKRRTSSCEDGPECGGTATDTTARPASRRRSGRTDRPQRSEDGPPGPPAFGPGGTAGPTPGWPA